MADSVERQIIARVVAQLASINGTGGYRHDVSAADRRVVGRILQPGLAPVVYVFAGPVATEQIGGRTVLTNFDHRFLVQIEGYVQATSQSPGDVLYQALDMLADIRKAIEDDRGLLGLARDVEVSATAFDGEELDLAGYGIAVVELAIIYARKSGAA